MINTLMKIGESTGNHVTFRGDYGFIPVVIGNDNRPVLLLRFIEILDGIIDYAELHEQLPSLSFSQIDGVFRFLKKISQINSRGVDIEDIEDEFDSDDVELIETLRTSLANQENGRVLFDDKRSR